MKIFEDVGTKALTTAADKARADVHCGLQDIKADVIRDFRVPSEDARAISEADSNLQDATTA